MRPARSSLLSVSRKPKISSSRDALKRHRRNGVNRLHLQIMRFHLIHGAGPLQGLFPERLRDPALNLFPELHRVAPLYLDQAPRKFLFAMNRRELAAAAGFGPGAAAPSTLLKPLENLYGMPLLATAESLTRRSVVSYLLFYFWERPNPSGATDGQRSIRRVYSRLNVWPMA